MPQKPHFYFPEGNWYGFWCRSHWGHNFIARPGCCCMCRGNAVAHYVKAIKKFIKWDCKTLFHSFQQHKGAINFLFVLSRFCGERERVFRIVRIHVHSRRGYVAYTAKVELKELSNLYKFVVQWMQLISKTKSNFNLLNFNGEWSFVFD